MKSYTLTDDEIFQSKLHATEFHELNHDHAVCQAQHLKTLNGILDEIDGMVDMWQGNPFKLVNGEYQERSFEDYLRQKLQVKPVKSKEYRIGSKNDLSL